MYLKALIQILKTEKNENWKLKKEVEFTPFRRLEKHQKKTRTL